MKQDMILILDLGSGENAQLAREIRALGVYSEIHPHDITLEELHALALRAREQKHASQETSALKAYNATLRERLERQNAELEAQRERFHALLGMYRQLLGANREFLSTSGIAGMGSLSGYVRDLSRSVAAGEAALGDVSS